jgi:cytochrome P450
VKSGVPGPRVTVLDLWKWMAHPYTYLDRHAARFGDTFAIAPLGLPEAVVFSAPDALADLFALPDDVAHGGAFNVVLRPFLGASSMLVVDGAPHRRQRKLLMPAFHGDRALAWEDAMRDITRARVATWPRGRAFALHHELQEITLGIVLQVVFGLTPGEQSFERILTSTRGWLEAGAWPWLQFPCFQLDLGARSPWGKFRRLSAQADAWVRVEIARRRAAARESHDVLGMLLQARGENGTPMSDAELLDALRTLVVAGHETVANALTWALGLVLDDAVLTAELAAESRGALRPLGDAIVKEALRLWPGVPMIGRILAKPTTIGGVSLDAKTAVVGSIYLAHRRAATYRDPGRFEPRRFLDARPTPTAYLPFGGGARRCLAAPFAMQEMSVVLSEILRSVHLARVDRHPLVPTRRGVTITPAGGVPVIASDRARGVS